MLYGVSDFRIVPVNLSACLQSTSLRECSAESSRARLISALLVRKRCAGHMVLPRHRRQYSLPQRQPVFHTGKGLMYPRPARSRLRRSRICSAGSRRRGGLPCSVLPASNEGAGGNPPRNSLYSADSGRWGRISSTSACGRGMTCTLRSSPTRSAAALPCCHAWAFCPPAPLSRIPFSLVKSMVAVTVAARISLTGSARNTPKT